MPDSTWINYEIYTITDKEGARCGQGWEQGEGNRDEQGAEAETENREG